MTMLIGSKLPPHKSKRTYFHSGRAAFSFLIEQVVRPRKVYLPTYTCWSLVTAMMLRFPDITLEFYPVHRDLTCVYPSYLHKDEALVFMHFFGHENTQPLPCGEGCFIEDFSHSYLSQIRPRGQYVFGSYRKIMKVADGGFIEGFFNPLYEPTRKLDSWLRLEATDWKDVREAENMLDRDWQVADISSQSLALLLTADEAGIRQKRQANNEYLAANLVVGVQHIDFRATECPMIHNRLMPSAEARDALRKYLAEKGVYTSIHWPTHDAVLRCGKDIADTLWLEQHVISFPVSHDYGLDAMEYICRCAERWNQKPV
jgi:hypothetical protein